MFAAAVRDLIWRRRRFAIAMVATALVMSMSLVMSGLSASFPAEIDRVLDTLGGEEYLAAEGANGPIYPGAVVPIAAGPPESAGVFFASAAIPLDGELTQVSVMGVESGKLGDPTPDDGEPISGPGTAVVSSELGLDIGETVTISDTTFTISGKVDGTTLFGGQPTLFVPIEDTQRLYAGGQPVATFLLAPPGTPAPDGFTEFSRDDAKADLLRPLENARAAIMFVTVLLWIVAACIVGSVVFLSAMERTRDFAVFKATGASTSSIAVGLMVQAVVLAIGAALVAIVLAMILAPFFPMPIAIPTSSMIRLPLIAAAVGVLASLAGLRRVLSVPPSMAFGGAS